MISEGRLARPTAPLRVTRRRTVLMVRGLALPPIPGNHRPLGGERGGGVGQVVHSEIRCGEGEIECSAVSFYAAVKRQP